MSVNPEYLPGMKFSMVAGTGKKETEEAIY